MGWNMSYPRVDEDELTRFIEQSERAARGAKIQWEWGSIYSLSRDLQDARALIPTPPAPVEPGDAGEDDAVFVAAVLDNGSIALANALGVSNATRFTRLALRGALTPPSTSATADDGWRSISSAPKDGTRFDVWVIPSADSIVHCEPYRIAKACYQHQNDGAWLHDPYGNVIDWREEGKQYVSHWRPLPPPPGTLSPTPTAWKRTFSLTTMDKAIADQWRADGHAVEVVDPAVAADAMAGADDGWRAELYVIESEDGYVVAESEPECSPETWDWRKAKAFPSSTGTSAPSATPGPAKGLGPQLRDLSETLSAFDVIRKAHDAEAAAHVRAPEPALPCALCGAEAGTVHDIRCNAEDSPEPARPDAARGEAVAWQWRPSGSIWTTRQQIEPNRSYAKDAAIASACQGYDIRPLYAAPPVAPTLAAWIAEQHQRLGNRKSDGVVGSRLRELLDRLAAAAPTLASAPADAGGMARAVEIVEGRYDQWAAKLNGLPANGNRQVYEHHRTKVEAGRVILAELRAALRQADARQDEGGVE